MIDPDDLVGAAELAAMLRVSRQRVQQFTKRPGFPAPVLELSLGRVWSRSAVAAWDAARKPPKVSAP